MKYITLLLSLICIFILNVNSNYVSDDFFPEIEGFSKSSVKKINNENFNGYLKLKSDLYKDYGLANIAVAEYLKQDNQKITVEIFEFLNPDLTFGIFNQDKSPEIQAFDKIGTQAYYYTGVLNFHKSNYYVRINAKGVENEETSVKNLAKQIADKIPGNSSLPLIFKKFPNFSRIIGFDRFIPKDFLGYSAFKNVYAADYNSVNGPFTFFAFSAGTSDASKKTLAEYYNTIGLNPPKFSDGRYVAEDPIFGRIDFLVQGNWVKGIFGPVDSVSRTEYLSFDYDEFMKRANLNGNIALNKNALSSSVEGGFYQPANAFDGDFSTRWSSVFRDSQWISVDIEKECKINRVFILWEGAFAEAYKIQVSKDGQNWITAYETDKSDGNIDDITFKPVAGRYVRLYTVKRHTAWGNSMYEFSVFKE